MDSIDIIMAIEGGELKIENDEQMDEVIELTRTLAMSQGFYVRLSEALKQFRADEDRIYPVIL